MNKNVSGWEGKRLHCTRVGGHKDRRHRAGRAGGCNDGRVGGQEGVKVQEWEAPRVAESDNARSGACNDGRTQGQEGPLVPFTCSPSHPYQPCTPGALASNEPPDEILTAWYLNTVAYPSNIHHIVVHFYWSNFGKSKSLLESSV